MLYIMEETPPDFAGLQRWQACKNTRRACAAHLSDGFDDKPSYIMVDTLEKWGALS